jgi:hypothetical protein
MPLYPRCRFVLIDLHEKAGKKSKKGKQKRKAKMAKK